MSERKRTAFLHYLLATVITLCGFADLTARNVTDCIQNCWLQRHGLKADGVYGKVDNLHIYYDGNRITGVLEDAADVIQPGSMEYHGAAVYRNGKVDMVLFPGGYATVSLSGVTFHYYTQDYLGNNRAVINGSTGAIEQTTAYYPYGGVIADLGTGNSGQPFRFGGKELISANGLNVFDFGARLHYPAIPQFDRIDKRCEDFYSLSPYLYCANNPINAIDSDGNFWETVWDVGNLLYDVGAAIVDHAKGNHQSAAGHWIDAGADGLAAIIPFVPAGASKLGKAAVAIEKASDAKSAGKGMKNASAIKEGKAYEKQVGKEMKDSGKNISEQVTIEAIDDGGKVIEGSRTRGDIILNNDGKISLFEIKRSSSTRLSPGQRVAEKHIKTGNGMFQIKSHKQNINFEYNQVIKIDDWQRINKYN